MKYQIYDQVNYNGRFITVFRIDGENKEAIKCFYYFTEESKPGDRQQAIDDAIKYINEQKNNQHRSELLMEL
jgi:hypothetical protein